MSQVRGYTLWISGLPNSGKTAFAVEVRARLVQQGLKAKLLGTSESSYNKGYEVISHDSIVEKLSEVGEPSNHIDVFILIEGCFDAAGRQQLQQQIGTVINILVKRQPVITQPDNVDRDCEFKTSNSGEIRTGFEEVPAPDLIFQSGIETLTEVVGRLMNLLKDRGLLSHVASDLESEEQMLMERLRDLGYI